MVLLYFLYCVKGQIKPAALGIVYDHEVHLGALDALTNKPLKTAYPVVVMNHEIPLFEVFYPRKQLRDPGFLNGSVRGPPSEHLKLGEHQETLKINPGR